MGIDPATFAVANGVLSAASSYFGAKDDAKAARRYNSQVVESMVDNYHQLAGVEADTLEASYQNSLEAQASAMQARASALSSAAAYGVMGGSVDMIIGEVERQRDVNMSNIIRSREVAMSDINSQATAIRKGSQASMQSIAKPSLLSSGLTGALSGIGTYSSLGGFS